MKKIEQLGRKLIKYQQNITVVESLTAGMFASQLANISGISSVFNGSFVTYSAEAKEKIVGVSAILIEKYGVVSTQVAKAMAQGAQVKMNTDWSISFTGVAGPEELEGHPVGTVYIGVLQPNKNVNVKSFHLIGNRKEIREQSVECGAQFILDLMKLNEKD